MCFIILANSDKVKQMIKNKPFLGYLVPLSQNKSSYKTFHMKMGLTCMKMNLMEEHISYGFTQRLVLTQRHEVTQKWLI